jgi:hypothetical protein
MSRTIEIIDHEQERTMRRQRKVLFFFILISLALFGYPVVKDYRTQWRALNGARELSLYLSMIKTRAILTKSPLEARFKHPDVIEVYEVSSCGPQATRTKLWEIKLSDLSVDIQFAEEAWVRNQVGSREPILPRFCYDPTFGSSIHADGLVHGAIYVVHRDDVAANRGDHAVQLTVEGPSGDVSIE